MKKVYLLTLIVILIGLTGCVTEQKVSEELDYTENKLNYDFNSSNKTQLAAEEVTKVNNTTTELQHYYKLHIKYSSSQPGDIKIKKVTMEGSNYKYFGVSPIGGDLFDRLLIKAEVNKNNSKNMNTSLTKSIRINSNSINPMIDNIKLEINDNIINKRKTLTQEINNKNFSS